MGKEGCCAGNRVDFNKNKLKKPRHLELTESTLETPSGTPLPAYSPLDPMGRAPQQHRGPGRPSMRQAGYTETVTPGSGAYEAKRPPGRPPGRHAHLPSHRILVSEPVLCHLRATISARVRQGMVFALHTGVQGCGWARQGCCAEVLQPR